MIHLSFDYLQQYVVKNNILLKVIIVGESGVGKTALMNHYVNNQFIESHKPTIGADFLIKNIEIDDNSMMLQMWDTAGQERFKSLGMSFYRGTDAVILVYDVTNLDSFHKIDEWKDEVLSTVAVDYKKKMMNHYQFHC